MITLNKTHPRYPSYIQTSIDWLGDIPEGWEVKKLKHVSEITLWKMLQDEDKWNGYLKPYLRAQNITWINADVRDVKEMYLSENELTRLRLKKWDLLISEGGEVWRTCIWKDEIEECYIQNSVNRVRSLGIHPSLLLYLFFTFWKKWVFDAMVNRVSIAHLTREKLKEVPVIVPPQEEQQAIASYLDEKTALLDEAIAKKRNQIDLLSEHRTALINNAVTKGLDQNAEMKESGVEWIGEIPKGWEVKKLKFLSQIKTGDWDTQDNVEDGKYPFFVRSDTIERMNSYSFDWEAILTAGDGVGVGRVFHHYIGKFAYHQRVYAITDFRWVLGKYLFYFIKDGFHKEVMKLSAKSTVDSLRRPMFLNFPVCFPSIKEQEQIVAYIDKETEYIDTMKAKLEQSIELLQEYKTSLISHAVSGKIKVL